MKRLVARFAPHFRQRRHRFLVSMLGRLERPLTILDVGGTPEYWDATGNAKEADIEVTLLNIVPFDVTQPHLHSVVGDARDLSQYANRTFDVVFSNSVIEHVGGYADQERMAAELQRVGKRYFVQTPNRSFPLEPHFIVPFFQFLPLSIRAFLLSRFSLGDCPRATSLTEALDVVASIRLMTFGELHAMFPHGQIVKEKVTGLTKSYVVYGGEDWTT